MNSNRDNRGHGGYPQEAPDVRGYGGYGTTPAGYNTQRVESSKKKDIATYKNFSPNKTQKTNQSQFARE